MLTGRRDLDLTIQFLEAMPKITENFLRTKPIMADDDVIFSENREALQFVVEWHAATTHDPRYIKLSISRNYIKTKLQMIEILLCFGKVLGIESCDISNAWRGSEFESQHVSILSL